jgi:hypothetical protein
VQARAWEQGGDERGRELRQGESHVINNAIEGVGEREKAPWPVGFDEAESDAVLRPAAPAPAPVSAQAPPLSGTVRRMAALTKAFQQQQQPRACGGDTGAGHRATVEHDAPVLKSHHACANQRATKVREEVALPLST